MIDGLLRDRPRGQGRALLPVRRHRREVVLQLGISSFGFSPLRLPPDLDFAGMFHGVDERVPIDALEFGMRVLDRFIDLC